MTIPKALLDLIGDRDDADLVLRMRRRDPQAIGVLYDRYGKAAYSLALRVVGNAGWAESIVAEAMLKCWNRMASFQEIRGCTVGVWLLVIVYSNALDHRRSVDAKIAERPGRPNTLEREAIFEDWSSCLDAGRVQDSYLGLRHLSAEETTILHLAFFDGLDLAELASRLSIPQTEVDKLIQSALQKLVPPER